MTDGRYDAEQAIRECRSRGFDVKRVIDQHGHGPRNGKWNSYRCPFCEGKSSAGVTEVNGTFLFKCFHNPCPSGNKALDEIGYLGQATGLSRRDAFEAYLKMSGVWRERERAKSPKAEPAPDKAQSPGDPTPDDEVPMEFLAQSSPEVDEAPIPAQAEAAPAPSGAEGPTPEAPEVIPPPEDPGESPTNVVEMPLPVDPSLAAVRDFYAALTWTEEDAAKCWAKRGLTSATQQALGFRSGLKTNVEVLRKLAETYDARELVGSGLWKWRKGDGPAPNAQFYGYGIAGRKEVPEGQEVDEDDKWTWGWTHPVLIPYVGKDGRVNRLRPHKGGAPGSTVCGRPGIYVPRALGEPARETFPKVMITEGEFKAAAFWQMMAGSKWGVCALPGISFARSVAARQELEAWLYEVGVVEVVVCFDLEEKGDPALPSYKADWTKRHDTTIYAQYLALDLRRKLGVRTSFGTLPREWMVQGKADWDGAAVELLKKRA